MRTDIRASGMELTDAIRAFIEKKSEALDPKIERFGTSVTTEVEVGKTSNHHKHGDIFRAEVRILLPGHDIYAEATDEDMYVALSEAYKEATRQVLAYKGTIEDKSKRGGRDVKEGE